MSDPTNPPPDDEDWGGAAGEPWREPQQPPPTEPPTPTGQPTGGAPPPPPQQPQQFYGGQTPPPPPHPGAPPPHVPNYLVHSIVATLLCCLPTGIVGIVYASQVNSKLGAGDLAGAKAASDKARLWSIISLAAGAVFWILYIVIYAVASSNNY